MKKNTTKKTAKGAKAEGAPSERRVLSMAQYLAMEKVAHAIERACRIRRKYVMAMKGATEVIDKNLDKLREIAWSEEGGERA